MANFDRQLIWKVYEEDGTFIEVLNDVISNLSVEKTINGGDNSFTFQLDRKMDDFDENTSIKFNNRIKVYLKDSFNPNGDKLVANGYIVSYKPYLRGKDEGVEVTCLSAVSKLSNDFYRTGTAAAASDLGVELTSQRVDQMMEAIINHYRSTETNSMITADFTDVEQTTDNTGALFSFDHRFFNMKHLDALREVSKFLPRNKAGGYWFYWRINTDGDLVLKNLATTAQHTFTIGRHITEISGEKSIEGVVNRVYFWNEKGTLDPDYLKLTSDDITSQSDNDIIAEYITDSKVTNPSAAALLADSKVYDKKDPKVKISLTLNGVYDLSSIEPGQTCQILNAKNNPYVVSTDKVLVIQSIKYEVDTATLELSEAADNFEDIVENERQRLDKEMTWFGYITQALTAAQLGPANRTWSTDIVFSATTGANAYRQVDWTAGTVYLPTSSGSEAGRRVIAAGNTGLMSAATDYYIYLDEETINTSAANSDSGTGIIKQGGEILGDASKSWSNDQYKGYIVTIGGQTKIIRSNTATILTIEDRWTIADTTGAYTIKKMTFDVSTDKSAISDITKIVFSNAKAAADPLSEASFSVSSNQNVNININGNQIAKRSISADEIIAGTITANEIAALTITAAKIAAGTITTAQLNFTPLFSAGSTSQIIATINASGEGIRIDADNIYISGSTTFASGYDPTSKLATADAGDLAYLDVVEAAKLGTTVIQGGYIVTNLVRADRILAGTITGWAINTGTLTGNAIQTASSGNRAVMGTSNHDFYTIYDSGNKVGVQIASSMINQWANSIYSGTAMFASQYSSPYTYHSWKLYNSTDGSGNPQAGIILYDAGTSTAEAGQIWAYGAELSPYTDSHCNLGTNAYRWLNVYADNMYCANQTADQHITGDLLFRDKKTKEILFRMDETGGTLKFYNRKDKLIMFLDEEGNLKVKGEISKI
ncbi:MAG: hypothetical protein WC346_08535 [Methanogenium sp.]|jgi:hypothetical protein